MGERNFDHQCKFGEDCKFLKIMQKSMLKKMWMNLIRVQNGGNAIPMNCKLLCYRFHDNKHIPCVHAWNETHNRYDCKFDHTYYYNPTAHEVLELIASMQSYSHYPVMTHVPMQQFFHPGMMYQMPTQAHIPTQVAPSAAVVAPAPVVASRPAPAAAASRPAPAAAAAVSQKADDQQPPFPAPSGKYWEQIKGGWVLKLNSTASK